MVEPKNSFNFKIACWMDRPKLWLKFEQNNFWKVQRTKLLLSYLTTEQLGVGVACTAVISLRR